MMTRQGNIFVVEAGVVYSMVLDMCIEIYVCLNWNFGQQIKIGDVSFWFLGDLVRQGNFWVREQQIFVLIWI